MRKSKNDFVTINKKDTLGDCAGHGDYWQVLSKNQPGPLVLFILGVGIVIGRFSKE